MILNFLRAAFLAMLLTSFSAHAALITSLANLDIGGMKYNVTFHSNISFNNLFDKDDDQQFNDNDGSTFNRSPTFFGNKPGADMAADAIIQALGTTDHTYTTNTGALRDGFLVPYAITGHTDHLVVFVADGDSTLSSDFRGGRDNMRRTLSTPRPIVSFEAVPTPPTLALTGLALGMMGFMGRRRRV